MTRKTQARRLDLRATTSLPAEPAEPPREGQTFAGESLLVRYANLVRLPHTVFALPFALVGVVYASYVAPVTIVKLVLVIVAFTAARFGVGGGAATAGHMSIAWVLIVGAEVRPMGANLVAFLCAFSVSFSGQYFWTFGARGDRGRAVRRFFLVSALAFLANNVVLAGLLKAGTLAPIWAVIFAACWAFSTKTALARTLLMTYAAWPGSTEG